MNKRSLLSQSKQLKSKANLNVVNFNHPRLVAEDASHRKLDDIYLLLDQGRVTEAEQQIAQLLKPTRANRENATLLSRARCALSLALEMQGRYREALEAIAMYEDAKTRIALDAEALCAVRVQLGSVCNYLGDHPKAVAILNAALRDVAHTDAAALIGSVYVALARVYRSINEYTIARDQAGKALEFYRQTGDWRGMAEAYFGLALADVFEGHWEAGLVHLEQARSLIGERPASYLLGKIYNNMAGACHFLKRPQEGIRHLEKAIGYYEQTELKANAMDGYNNLGINLILVGDWEQAEKALEKALALAAEMEERRAEMATIIDSLGELQMLRGNLPEAQQRLEQAVAIATETGNKWYEGQAIRTLSQCLLLQGEVTQAQQLAEHALTLGEKIGDRQAVCESRLLLAEAALEAGHLEKCVEELHLVQAAIKDSAHDLAIAGNTYRLQGRLALTRREYSRAVHYFGRTVSVFELLGDVYRIAQAHYWQGCACAPTQPKRAEEHLQRAMTIFAKLGAKLALTEAENVLATLYSAVEVHHDEIASYLHLLMSRLSEATASRELLLRELGAVIRDETSAEKVLIIEVAHRLQPQARVVVAQGWPVAEQAALTEEFQHLFSDEERERFARERNLTLLSLQPTKAVPATVLIAPRDSAALPFGFSLDSLLRIVELGLNTCALHEKEAPGSERREPSATTTQSLIPGFIHSSPAMMRLVDEIQKIRSSDVTVLITGESGTGKELVARAIHALSSRHSKVFVPFNCTAVPKELSDAFLFGYKRGAYTGAVADSAGVIRAATGGTLFLDEVGDLQMEIQPKLLRFLQEGEIQPLGEQRPSKVDVRVIAATNSELEEMVAAGQFREDLYYRLNVIRLHVPPLRERRSEIPAIVNHYIKHYSDKFGRRNIRINSRALDLLMVYDWPGNVRQLTNEIQRIVARTEDGALISPDLLSSELRQQNTPTNSITSIQALPELPSQFWENLTMSVAVDNFKRYVLVETLRKNNGNVSRSARVLGLTRRGLQLMLVRYGLGSGN